MQFYVTKNNAQVGPFSLMDLRQRLQNGEFAYTDLAWRDGLKDWTPLSELMGGALPESVPNWIAPDSMSPKPKRAPTVMRVITAIGLTCLLFAAFFMVVFFLGCIIVGVTAGVHSGMEQAAHGTAASNAQTTDDVSKKYVPMIMEGAAIFALVASPIAGALMAFSNLFPWCRKR